MMNTHKNLGFGLVEVLIAMLVIAGGVLALARFQTTILSESRTNKARSEAQAICSKYLAVPRSLVDGSQTSPVLPAAGTSLILKSSDDEIDLDGDLNPDSFIVDNYTVTLTRSVDDLLTATCSWSDGEVSVSTLLAPHNLVAGALYSTADQGGGSSFATSPTLNANSSTDITQRVQLTETRGAREIITSPDLLDGVTQVADDEYYVVDRNGTTASLAYACSALAQDDGTEPQLLSGPFDENDSPTYMPVPYEYNSTTVSYSREPQLKALRVYIEGDATSVENILTGTEVLPKRGIKLYETATDNEGTPLCIPRVRYNGGVIVPITGTIYSSYEGRTEDYLPINLFTFNTSESGTYCYFSPQENASSEQYACYVGGNCRYNAPTDAESWVTQFGNNEDNWEVNFSVCPPYELAALENETNFGPGGWRGRVGVLEAAEDYNLCFYEEVWDDSEYTQIKNTARSYYTRNTYIQGETTYDKNEGLNKPQNCQNFLLITQRSNNLDQWCQDAADSLTTKPYLAPRTIERYLDSYPTPGDNNYDPETDLGTPSPANAWNCPVPSLVTIEGTISQSTTAENANAIPQITAAYEDPDGMYPSWETLCFATETRYSCDVNLYDDQEIEDITITGAFGTWESPTDDLCSSFDVPNGNPDYDYDGCDIDLRDWNRDSEELLIFSGEISGTTSGIKYLRATQIKPRPGSDTDMISYGCTINSTGDSTGVFSCTVVVAPDSLPETTTLNISGTSNYNVDLSSVTDERQLSGDFSLSQSSLELIQYNLTDDVYVLDTDDATLINITVSRNDTFTLSGAIAWQNDNTISNTGQLTISPGNSELNCDLFDSDGFKINDSTTQPASYSCSIISGSDITFQITSNCAGSRLVNIKWLDDGDTSNGKTLIRSFDTVSYNFLNKDIEICAAQ